MFFKIRQESRGMVKIIIDEAFIKRFTDIRKPIEKYVGTLSLGLLNSKIRELHNRIKEKENNGPSLKNIKDKALLLIFHLSTRGVKIDGISNIYPNKRENLTNLDIASMVFQDLFGIIEQLDRLKIEKQLKKQITAIKTNLKTCYFGYLIKNDKTTPGLAENHNKRRLGSITESLNLLRNLKQLNPDNYELGVLIFNTYQIHQSFVDYNSPSPVCKVLMQEQLKQFKEDSIELQTLLEPTELW
jgi:hypothetical protein